MPPNFLGRFVWVRSDVKTVFHCQFENFGKNGNLENRDRLTKGGISQQGGLGGQQPPQVISSG